MNNKIKIGLVVLIIIIGFTFVVINHQSKELRDVLQSPMANLQLITAEELERSYYDRGTTLGKPDYVTMHISYQPKVNYTKADVYNELVKNMKQVINNSDEITFDGKYDGEKLNNDGDFYSASFSYKTHLRLDLSIYEPTYKSEENTILVNIKNYGRYPDIDLIMTIKDIFTL